MSKLSDKEIEKNRYNKLASEKIYSSEKISKNFGKDSVKETLRDPYTFYEESIQKRLFSPKSCLELGSGEGRFTRLLLDTGANISCLDISKLANMINRKINSSYKNLNLYEGDIEKIPFPNNHFDYVVNAGSLSYGKKSYVKSELIRVLKYDGYFIAVDSLNNSPIYKLNRYLRYIFGDRSMMTLKNMWNLNDLKEFADHFEENEMHFFGTISWLEPIITKLIGEKRFIKLSRSIDSIPWLKFLSFKFVFVGKRLKNKDSNNLR